MTELDNGIPTSTKEMKNLVEVCPNLTPQNPRNFDSITTANRHPKPHTIYSQHSAQLKNIGTSTQIEPSQNPRQLTHKTYLNSSKIEPNEVYKTHGSKGQINTLLR